MADAHTHAPHQARSRRTERAIADAFSALLREKPFPDITVAEIAERAGVSVGGIYARYASKEALLAMVELGILEEFAATAEEQLANAGSSAGEIALAYARLIVSGFRERRAEILQILRYSQNNPASQEQLRKFNVGVHDRMRDLLRGHGSDLRINMAIFFAGAAAREAILMRNLRVYPVELSDDQLAEEIAAAFEAYVSRRG